MPEHEHNTAHTPTGEGHPDLEGERTDRDVGGPALSDEEREKDGTTETGGAHGDRPTPGLEPHE